MRAARIFTLGILMAGGAAGGATQACGDAKSAIMLSVTTDMKAPKDVSAVSVTVSTNDRVKHNVIGRVTPQGEVLLPATLAIVEPEDPDASIRIRVMAFQERRARVLRDVRTSIPAGGRVALLRIPLNFVNDASTSGTLPEAALPAPSPGTATPAPAPADGGPAPDGGPVLGGDSFDAFAFRSTCADPAQTVIEGECRDAYVDPATLPDFEEGLVGRGDDSATCFDVARCFASSERVALDEGGGCSLPFSGDASKLNLAFVTPDTGECVRPGACYVPLDRGVSGWQPEPGGRVRLPAYVCRLARAKGLELHRATGCDAKTDSRPICRESPVTDAGTGAIAARLVAPQDWPASVALGAGHVVLAGANGLVTVDPRGTVRPVPGLPEERRPWQVIVVGDGTASHAVVDGTNTGYLLMAEGRAVTITLPGPGVGAGHISGEAGDLVLWGLGGAGNAGFATSPLTGQGTATRTGPALAEDMTAITTFFGVPIVGDALGGVRLCDARGECKPRNQALPGRIDALRVIDSDVGYAIGPDGIYRSIVVDTDTGAVTGDAVAVPARVAGTTIEGKYYRHALDALSEQFQSCVLFTSDDGVEVARTGAARRVLVSLPASPMRRALGLVVGPRFGGDGGIGAASEPGIYFTVFASRADGGGLYTVDLPPECARIDTTSTVELDVNGTVQRLFGRVYDDGGAVTIEGCDSDDACLESFEIRVRTLTAGTSSCAALDGDVPSLTRRTVAGVATSVPPGGQTPSCSVVVTESATPPGRAKGTFQGRLFTADGPTVDVTGRFDVFRRR